MTIGRRSAICVGFAALLVLAACAPVTYEGHDQSPTASAIGPNQYRIYVEGNRRNNRQEIEAFGLAKAAETTLEKQHAYFRVLSDRFRSRTGQEPYYTFTLEIETFAAGDVPEDGEGYLEAEPIASRFGPFARGVQ